MNIYIYGDKLFIKEISKVLEKQSIIDKLDEIAQTDDLLGQIIEIRKLRELKDTIEFEPNNIFLIDNKKIIQDDNIIFKTIKFLNPKDGIEKSFLDMHELAITVELNDVASISQYILDRLDTYKLDEITQLEEIRLNDMATAVSEI